MLPYKDLIYSSPNWRETLVKFQPIENNRYKIETEPYPSEQVLAAFAQLAYSNCKGELVLPGDWSLLTTAKNSSWMGKIFTGYFGCAFWSPSLQQIVIAHRGTIPSKLGALWADGKGVFFNSYTNHMCSAITFAEDVKEEIQKINKDHRHCRFVLSFSGHSLGAWLAGVTTLTVKYFKSDGKNFHWIVGPEEGLHAHTLALESPGVKKMLLKLCKDFIDPYNPSRFMFTEEINITNILCDPNLVNRTGIHAGNIHYIPMKDLKDATTFNMDTHSLDPLIKAINDDNRKRLVVEHWPRGLAGRKTIQGDGWPLMENCFRKTCHLGVFSTEELKFVKNMSFFRSNTLIKLSEIENFSNSLNIKELDFPEIKINARRKTITCDSKTGDLEKVIRQTKQLFRWFPEEITYAVNKQNDSIKTAPLYLTGQAYLRTLSDILDCEDTLELNKFLENPNQRVLQIESSDTKFEAARLNNILLNTEITPLNEKYLKDDNCHTSLSWSNLIDVAKKIDIKALNKMSITINNLLILEFASPTDNSLPNDTFKILLTNLVECSLKKLVIILLPENKNQLFKDFTLTVGTKPLKSFEISDLTEESREDIFERDAIVLGEEILSLNTLLGVDCKSVDEEVRNKINSLISPISKKLATDASYKAYIPTKLPRLCELEALYSTGNRLVDKVKLTALLERSGAAGPLLVISDPEQLSQDDWGEGAEPARGRIFTTEDDGQDRFKEKCREESARIIYWLCLSAEGVFLKEVYNRGLYMPRKFHTCLIIKSMNEFVGYSGNKDVFIFNNAKDKLSLIRSFNLSKEDEEIFVSKEHFKLNTEDTMEEETFNKHNLRDHLKIQNRSHELNSEKTNEKEMFNEHYFEKMDIKGSPCLVWQYSHGSLDGLRRFITRDYSDPIEEDAFCNTRNKLTIIADDPGMGKTTSLTRISELIRDSWVLRIDHNHLTAIEKLPSKLNLRSVTKCLIHASGLPTDDDFLRSLLQHCLESDSSRHVCILVDAFDEITKENSKVKTLRFLKYLKNNTNCKTVVTTRVHPQEWLENELSEFSTELQKITKTEQDDFMVNSWLPHLALELPEHEEKGRLRQFARELREEMEGVLGKDVVSFMGIPLQIRMLAEVFLQQAIQSVVSPEPAQNLCKITNVYDLYTQFIEVKKSIYLEQKNIFNKGLPDSFLNDMVMKIMKKHCVLAFQSLGPKFAAEYYSNIILSNQDLQELSVLGLIKAGIDGTVTFIHRTFEEYFCADFFAHWLRQKNQRIQNKENIIRIKNQLCIFLLRPDYYLIRKFIETQLAKSPPISSDALKSNPILYKHWSENRLLFFHDRVKTLLHIAAEEQNVHTFAVLLSGPSSRISDEDYICFMTARDKAGRTALNIALENRNFNIVKQIEGIMEISSYESLLKLMLASFLDFECDKDQNLFRECTSNKQPSSSLHRTLIRSEQIKKQITPFMVAVREDDYSTVNKIFNGMESDTERAHLLIAIDSQGDTAINLAASKEDHTLFILFAKQGVCMSFDKCEKNPLHCAAKEGNLGIVKYLLNPTKNSYTRLKKTPPIGLNDNQTDEEATAFPYTGVYQMFSSIQSMDGSSSLMLAAQGGHYEIVLILLEKLADIHTRDNDGWTALMTAASRGHLEIVEHLLLNGAELNYQDKNGFSALLIASNHGHFATVRKLLEKGANFHVRHNDGWTALMTAASRGHLEIVEHLLLKGAELNSQVKNGDSALLLASYHGHLATVGKLLEKGADIHMRANDGMTALMTAASRGHLEIVERLLLNGAELNYQDKNGDSALLFGALNGHLATVCKLLEKGADIHVRDNDGWTALMTAASKGHLEIVEHLLLKGADHNSQKKNGNSALLLAANNGHLATVRKLLEKGADIHVRDNDGWTALMTAVSKGHLEIVEHLLLNGAELNSQNKNGVSALLLGALNGHLATVCKLLEKGADIHVRDNYGWTALMTAASKGHLEIVEHLLLKGADLNSQKKNGNLALLLAANNGHLATVRKLLEKGADIHLRNNDGWTALMLAASKGHLEIVEHLLLKGADIHMRADDGWTALTNAANKGHLDIVEHLLLNGAEINYQVKNGVSALFLAALNGHLATVCKLLEKGADIHVRDNNGCTALMLAAHGGHLEIVERLLLKGAELNSQAKNGDSAFLLATYHGHFATVCKLLEKGADIHVRDNDGMTALMTAACGGHLEIVEHLLLNGAELNSQKKDGFSALLLASYHGHFSTVCKLLEKGADIQVRGNDGWTALMLAAHGKHLEIVEHLLLKGAELNYQVKNGYSALLLAANNGHLATLCKLLEKGADIHIRDNDGSTALMIAASRGHLEIVEHLLLNDADLNSQKKDGYSALLLAALNGHLATVCKLLEKGADIHIRDNDGWTSLMITADKGHLEVVELLLLKGADIHMRNNDGRTALMLAASKGRLELVELLLLKGADVHAISNLGHSALNHAVFMGHLEIVELLLLNGADLNLRDVDGDTALLHSAELGQAEMMVFLLQRGVDVNSQRDDGRTALSWAALKGHMNVVEILLQYNADFSCQDKDGKTALSWAEEKGYGEVVELIRSHQEANPTESLPSINVGPTHSTKSNFNNILGITLEGTSTLKPATLYRYPWTLVEKISTI